MKENGFEYVDLGLPSGTMWATCNVGADKPEDPGLLFQFGRVDGYAYGDTNNKFTKVDENAKLTGYTYINPTTSGVEYVAGQILNLEDDAAHVNMGGKWKMPTKADLQELYDNTTRQVININDMKGMLFTSNINGKSIFILFDGCFNYNDGKFYGSGSNGYLSSSEVELNGTEYVWQLGVYSSKYCSIGNSARAYGFSVRGVLK